MSKSVIKISETFMLRRIDPVCILKNYLKGGYKNLEIPKQKIKSKNKRISLGKNYGDNNSYEIYRFKDKSNSKQVILTTNHLIYKHSVDKILGQNVERPIVKCLYCKRKINKTPIGIPISMETNNKTKEIKFHVDGTYCNFNCMFADFKRINDTSRIYKDPLYMDAEQLIHVMFHKMYPKQEKKRIREAPDWRLLRENGGPLTDKEFDEGNFVFIPMTSVVQVPVKRQYIKLNIK